MTKPCTDCPDTTNKCGSLCDTVVDGAISSCMSSLGITENMGSCLVISKLADAICNIMSTSLSSVCVKDIAFVSPSTCGDDATGIVGRLDKPFATIKAAVKAVRIASGKLVWVWSGSYSESNINFGSDSIEWTNPFYYLVEGTTVDGGSTGVFNAITANTTITVKGAGIITSSGGTIRSNTTLFTVNYDIQCDTLSSTGTDALSNALQMFNGTAYLHCRKITTTGNSCIDVRTGTTTGYVTCDVIDNSSSATRASAFQSSGTGTHLWKLSVKQTYSNPNDVKAGVFVLGAGSSVEWTGDVTVNSLDSPGSFCSGIGNNGGQLIFNGNVRTTGCSGVCNVAGTTVINGLVRTTGNFAAIFMSNPTGNGIVILNGYAVNSSATVATILYNGGALTALVQSNNSIIKNESSDAGAKAVEMTAAAQGLLLKDTYLLTNNAAATAVYSVGAQTVKATGSYANCSSSGGVVFSLESLTVFSGLQAFVPL